MRVDVCVATYRRPKGLRRLLGALQELELAEPAPELRVVVVDNDPERSARPLCEEAAGWLRFPLHYVPEKRRGIPQARNAAVAAALDHADFIAFIDDDEAPSPRWLAELLRVQQSHGADAVAGPSLPVFEVPPPAWVEPSRLFERRRHTTGARIDHAFTHNVLVSTASLSRMDALFDEEMALLGGSDGEFFRRFARQGHVIVWADDAVVSEWIPASRLRVGWVLRRHFRVGTSSVWVDRRRREAPVSVLYILTRGGWCIVKGGALLLPAVFRGRAAAVRALRIAAVGAGRIAGLLGFRYQEYRKVHGS